MNAGTLTPKYRPALTPTTAELIDSTVETIVDPDKKGSSELKETVIETLKK